MAEVITRFKLETTQYDSKLRDAAKGLSDYTKHASLAGSEFAKFTQKNVEAARSFGNIATSATNSKDKVKELVTAFNDVARAYNSLTKEQQQSDFGKALAESMQQLKTRISDAKAEMNSTGGSLGQLKNKFVVNLDAVKLFTAGITAAKAALEVAKDAFFASEANLDEWNRTVYASKSAYEGFLIAINTGDISGYLDRIDEIVKAARTAYNELDRLSTMKAINAPRVTAQQTENERMRAMLRTGRYIAPNDGRKAAMAEGTKLTKEQLDTIARKLENGMKAVNAIIKEEIQQSTRAIEALYAEQAKRLGMSKSEFLAGTSSMTAFDARLAGYRQYQDWEGRKAAAKAAASSGHNISKEQAAYLTGTNPYAQYRAWGVFKDDGALYQRIVSEIQNRAQLQNQNYAATANMYRQINRADGFNPYGGGSGKVRKDSATTVQGFSDFLAKSGLGADSMKSAEEFVSPYMLMLDEIKEKILDVKDADLGSALDIPDVYQQKIKEMERNLKAVVKSANITADVVGNIGQAFMSIEDPAAKVAGTVMQAIASVALGYAQATVNAAEMGPWAWIAFAASGLATMLATISSIHSATGYASGGEIKGNTYSGDQIPIMANAGEIILNRAQQSSLAQSITSGGGMQNINVIGKLHGTDMVLLVDRTLKTQGKELAVWGR